MVNRIRSGTLDGIDGCGVIVEIDAGRGLPSFQIVGLPNAAVRESRERVMAAVRNSGFAWPQGRVVVSLVPADMPKEGASLDLAIAVGVCTQADKRPPAQAWRKTVLLGELSLSGALRPIRGLLAMILDAAGSGCEACVVPRSQAAEVDRVEGVEIIAATSLEEVVDWYRHDHRPPPRKPILTDPVGPRPSPPRGEAALLYSLPSRIRRLVEITAAGRHNLLMCGPPGSGKTRLARLIGHLQPRPEPAERLEISRIQGAAGLPATGSPGRERPFRAPHHTITRAGLVGGGGSSRPGEVTLAHLGVLFLDEIAEFNPQVLDALREPLESGQLLLSRVNGHRCWPAAFQLLAAMNPCRCGLLGSRRGECRCRPREIQRYRQRLSGPLLDRLDIITEIEEEGDWTLGRDADPQAAVGLWRESEERIARVHAALAPVADPGKGRHFDLAEARTWLDADGADFLDSVRSGLGLSIRGVLRCLHVARSLAGLDAAPGITRGHLAEALALRGAIFGNRS